MDTFVEKLNNNPIFQLSLSSKELFHSNFLAWLAEDKNTQALFKKILSTWLGEDTFDYNTDCMEIKRGSRPSGVVVAPVGRWRAFQRTVALGILRPT